MVVENRFNNSLLKSLTPEIVSRLSLERVEFKVKHELEYPGKPIRHLFFVEQGMASMTTTFQNGAQVEVSMFGYESVVGVSALMGTKQSLNRVFTQIPGYGYSSPIEAVRREFARGGSFQLLMLHYVQAQLVQAMQSAACNITHDINHRLARWLLLCADRVKTNTFTLSHEFLAEMLGARRPTVSVAAKSLKDRRIIDYYRGRIHLLNREALEANACECYGVIRDHLDSYTQFDSGIVA